MKKLIVSIAALAGAVVLGALILHYDTGRAPQLCQVCARPVHAGMGYRLVLAQGSEAACCPRCGMHFELQHPGTVQGAFARDFISGAEIPAASAFYVEGGDEEFCATVQPVVRKEPEGSAELAFDRCVPPLVAFAKESDAQEYRSDHGGRVIGYDQAIASVRMR